MPHYHIWTIGCQMNKAESERLGSILEQRGYRSTAAPEKADVIILNTCVVRGSAEDRAVNKLHLLRPLKKQRPDVTLAVTGCMVDSDATTLKKAFPHVDYFFKAGDYPQWLDEIRHAELLPQKPGVSVYMPIMQGCDNFCSYCIVPYRRGRERSRPAEDVVAEVKELVRRGAREIVLLGQNVDSYGHDLADRPDLADLLEELNGIDGLLRLRFLTNHPKDMSRKLIERVASLDKVCEHLNLPIQSGDDRILEAMRRGYTTERYRQLVTDIRNRIPDVALSTDVIVGFPSETEEQFRHTVDLLADLRFDTVHVACYSPRAGTLAAKQFTDDVPQGEKKRRLKVVEDLQQGILTEINARLVGTTVDVLVEGKTRGKWRGRTRSDKLVFFGDQDNCLGRLVRVRLNRASPWSLQGLLH